MMKHSVKALDAVVNAVHRGQGAKVTATPEVLRELREAGLVGPDNGLTRSGTILRERETSARMDDLF